MYLQPTQCNPNSYSTLEKKKKGRPLVTQLWVESVAPTFAITVHAPVEMVVVMLLLNLGQNIFIALKSRKLLPTMEMIFGQQHKIRCLVITYLQNHRKLFWLLLIFNFFVLVLGRSTSWDSVSGSLRAEPGRLRLPVSRHYCTCSLWTSRRHGRFQVCRIVFQIWMHLLRWGFILLQSVLCTSLRRIWRNTSLNTC